MMLERARLLRSLGRAEEEVTECLKRAATAFENVAGLEGEAEADPEDFRATAWYNLACVAGLLGRADRTAHAMKMCLGRVSKANRRGWISEACADVDLRSVVNHPEVQEILAKA